MFKIYASLYNFADWVSHKLFKFMPVATISRVLHLTNCLNLCKSLQFPGFGISRIVEIYAGRYSFAGSASLTLSAVHSE